MPWLKTKKILVSKIRVLVSLVLALGLSYWLGQKFLVKNTFLIDPLAKQQTIFLVKKTKSSVVDFIKEKILIRPNPAQPTPAFPVPTLSTPEVSPTPAEESPAVSPLPSGSLPSPSPKAPTVTPIPTRAKVSLEDFAKCLTQKGMKMYSDRSCGICGQQRALFGSAFSHIIDINCRVQPGKCAGKNLRGYPIWEDGAGKMYPGLQSLANLAQISGCQL